MDDATKCANDAILARIQGVAATTSSRLEATMDPTNPNVFEANDNEPEEIRPSCGCVFCDLKVCATHSVR